MADDIQFKASIDDSQVDASAARMETRVKKAASSIQADFNRINISQQRMGGGGGNGNYRIGQAALQAQDVAVQLQSGAKFATVLAQQGSQIASIFGPQGQLIGGVIAIGAGILGWALNMDKAITMAEVLEMHTKNFEARQQKKRDLGDLASASIGSNFSADQDLEARIKGGAMLEKEVRLDRERNREIQQTYDLMTDLALAQANMSSDEEIAWMTSIERKHAAEAILQISERIEKVMSKIGEGEQAAAAAAGAEINMQKQLVNMEEAHLQKFGERQDKEEKSKKNAQDLIDKAEKLAALATKGLHGLFDQYGLEAQTKEIAKQFLTAQKIQTLADIKKADDLLDPTGAKARDKQKRRQFIADRTIAERAINQLDRENGGLPGHHHLSPAERKAAVDARVRRAQAERNGKTKVALDDADITKLATAMMAAAAQQNAK